ncbi:hypothetical protein [Arvimicrobium flavum]|uniref:hypothetical protein n=1 Tax=Arvimicrobium flavum TaxID=3393320 RepID=UPI00237C1BC9|nr:hypothetical protein [Mesorhizobium shangrilense]
MQIVIAKQLNEETYEARAVALALVDSIEGSSVVPREPGRSRAGKSNAPARI